MYVPTGYHTTSESLELNWTLIFFVVVFAWYLLFITQFNVETGKYIKLIVVSVS